MDICEKGRWKPIGDWTEEADPPNCPGFEFRGKCVIECCKARGMNVNFYLGNRALFLYDPIEDPERKHPQGMRIMSFIRVRALAKLIARESVECRQRSSSTRMCLWSSLVGQSHLQ